MIHLSSARIRNRKGYTQTDRNKGFAENPSIWVTGLDPFHSLYFRLGRYQLISELTDSRLGNLVPDVRCCCYVIFWVNEYRYRSGYNRISRVIKLHETR